MADKVQNILQNNLKGTACAEKITWQTEDQQATTAGHTDLNVTFLSNTNTM